MANILQYASYTFYIVMPVAGVVLNCYVFGRLMKIARRSGTRFETTSGLPLSAMSLSDSVCLLATLSQFIFHVTITSSRLKKELAEPSSDPYFSFICKIDLYLLHSTSAFSVWCWLLLSIMRYVAVFHPFKYRTIWKQPRYALKALALACASSEVWILFMVVYDDKGRTCREDDKYTDRQIKVAHLTDIIVFYAIPSGLRIVFDSLVLFRCYSCHGGFDDTSPIYDRRLAISAASVERKPRLFELRSLNSSFEFDSLDGNPSSSASGRAQLVLIANLTSSIQRRPSHALVVPDSPHACGNGALLTNCAASRSSRSKSQALSKRRTKMILRSLVISMFNLLCNLPSHILRAWVTLYPNADSDFIEFAEQLSQILYFSQFACNAFYLSTSIYETSLPTRHAPISTIGRQISRCDSRDADEYSSQVAGVKRQISQPDYLEAPKVHVRNGGMRRQASHPEYIDADHRTPPMRRQDTTSSSLEELTKLV